MRKAYSNYSEMEPYADGWTDTAYSETGYSDHVCRPVVVDAEGRKNPIFGFPGLHNAEGYVVKSERIVEHISHTAPVIRLVSDYGYVPEPVGDYKRYAHHGSGYDHPKVDNFLTKVQNDVSRPATKASVPFSSNWRDRPSNIGNRGTATTNYSDDSDHIWEKPSEAYPQTYKGAAPHDKNMYYEKPRGNEIVPSHPLSKPTNDIVTAVDFLTEAIKPINFQTYATRPNKAVPLSSIPWRTGTNLAAKDRNLDSEEDDWENPKEQQMYGRSKIPGLPEPTNRIDNKEGYNKPAMYYEKPAPIPAPSQQPRFTVPTMQNKEKEPAMYYEKPAPIPAPSQQPRFTVPTMQNKEKYSPQPPPDTIDSSEARRRYSKQKSQPVAEDAFTGTIDSNEVVKKYNGTKVPW